MDLIASTGTHLRFWNLQTSDPLRKIASPCPLGITCMTTDKPDPRRLYLGTSEGGIAVVHIVTGQVLYIRREIRLLTGFGGVCMGKRGESLVHLLVSCSHDP